MARTYKISSGVMARAESLGIDGATAEARILQMAKQAARITHPDANYRFREYIMYIEKDGTVAMLDRMDAEEDGYYTRRQYQDRKRDQAEEPPVDGEAVVTPKK